MGEAPFYPISNLSDILSKFRAELNIALADVYKRIEVLEGQLAQGGVGGGVLAPELMGTRYAEYEPFTEEEASTTTVDLKGMYIATLQARRALYGYAMALDAMGLSKDQKQAVKEMENLVTAAIRLYQTWIMIQDAMAAFTATGVFAFSPWGAIYLAMAGGMGLASLIYMGRASGG